MLMLHRLSESVGMHDVGTIGVGLSSVGAPHEFTLNAGALSVSTLSMRVLHCSVLCLLWSQSFG